MAGDEIILINSPNIPGLRFRHFQGANDYPHMARIIAACADVDKLERADTAENIANAFNYLINCDPYQDMLFAEVNGEVIGYSRVWWWTEYNDTYLYGFIGFLTPSWRRKGIGRVMLHWIENRLREIGAQHSQGQPQLFQTFVTQHQTGQSAMLEREGYRAVRYAFQMLRPTLDDIPDFPLPAGIEVRQVLPEHYRSIWEADMEAIRDNWGTGPQMEEMYEAWLDNETIFQPHLWEVAWDIATNQVAGQVRAFINQAENEKYNRRRGYTEFISVGRHWRKQGIARALIVRSLRRQKEEGMTESALGVDSENGSGATRVYEACGFRVVKRDTFYRKPLFE
ncbi:MAG TPA: GNAT family N-acetyltransferase [Pyrinomonadaceae bacterium]|nr:GNAT family N-acetyltransferase [Pyrinomonadaceae bacterium]